MCKKEIELIVIDITVIKNFNKKNALKFLNYIINEIDDKLVDVDKYLLNGIERKIIINKKIKRCDCGIEIKSKSLRCRSCSNKNKKVIRCSNRPSYEILLGDFNSLGYKKTGEKYKVDRTTIYRWLKNYENIKAGTHMV